MEQIFTILLSCFCTIAIAFAFTSLTIIAILLTCNIVRSVKYFELHAGKHLWFKIKRK
jgi:hypothetical protein|nr:MAG TPA: hypothetical protein [Caudoviricetes sp.]